MFADHVLRTLESDARATLSSALSLLPAPRILLVDDTLFDFRLNHCRPLDLFTDASYLRDHSIQSIIPISKFTNTSISSIFIIIRGINATAARQAVTILRSKLPSQSAVVLTTPRRSTLVEKIMTLANLAQTVPVVPLEWGFLPFDADCISLDWPDAFRQVVLDGDNSSIMAAALALKRFARVMRVSYATVRTAGAAAAAVVEQLLHTHGQTFKLTGGSNGRIHPSRQSTTTSTKHTTNSSVLFTPEHAFNNHNSSSSDPTNTSNPITLIVLDRSVDVVTPLLTQWTYEGMLDESIGLRNTMIDMPISSIQSADALNILRTSPNASGTIRKRLRNDVDALFVSLRDLNYWSAARQIGTIATSVRAYYQSRPSELSQVKNYVRGLKNVKSEHASATAHTALAAEISARTFDSLDFKKRFEVERDMIEGAAAPLARRVLFITDAIAKGESLSHVIRLVALWSVTANGIPIDDADTIKREMLANYGLSVLSLITNMERAGLFIRNIREQNQNQSQNNLSWQFSRAALRLVTDFDPEREVRPGTAAAISSPYSGYTPLSARLVEAALSDEGWSALPAVASHNLLLPPGHVTHEHVLSQHKPKKEQKQQFDALILVVGGIVRAEASAIRLAARAAGVKALIATTAVVGPDEFVLSLTDKNAIKKRKKP